jgi:hypothetical protein
VFRGESFGPCQFGSSPSMTQRVRFKKVAGMCHLYRTPAFVKGASWTCTELLVAGLSPSQRSGSEVDMKILDRFPIRDRGTGVVVSHNGHSPAPGQHLRRPSDGREWLIEAVDERTGAGKSLALCIVGDPPSVGDEVILRE